MQDTIVATASGMQRAAIGVIRISGHDVLKIMRRIFRGGKSDKLKDRLAIKGWIVEYDSGNKIDEVVVIYYKNPKSYTGEDMVEIFSHGNPFIMNEIVHNCVKAGARIAKEGEFTYRAFMNGRIDLIQAEAINELIQAESIYAVRNALGKLKGGLSELVLKIRNKLIDLIADMEAEINFGETDQIENQGNYIKDINLIKKEIKEILKNHDNSRFITDNYKIASVGKPNVGKSSLFNALLQKERAIITDIPGTTRDYIEDRIIIENLPVILIDTAGIRISNDKIEKIGIEKTKEIIDYSDKIIAVLDSATELDEQDMYIFKSWKDKICLVVMNKIDLAERIDIRAVEREVKAYKTPIIKTSIIKKLGIEEVRECIRKAIKTLISKRRNDAGYILNERQYDYLMNALKEIDKAKRDLLRGVSVEYAIMNLYEATKGLEELTGEISVEEVLDQIFSKFCIGK